MIAMKIFYPNISGSRFDFDYYKNCHMKRVKELAGDLCKGIVIEASLNSGDTPYRAIGTELYESVDDYHKALDEYRFELRQDIKNFTDIKPVIQFLTISGF